MGFLSEPLENTTYFFCRAVNVGSASRCVVCVCGKEGRSVPSLWSSDDWEKLPSRFGVA